MSPRRPLLLAALAAVTAAPAVAATGSSPSRADEKPRLAAKLTDCTVGEDASGGSAIFTGSMPAIRRASRLWQRFTLERRSLTDPDADWERVSAPTFGEWEKSRRGVSGFVYSKTVEGLTAPAAYRAVVRFRWVDRRGRTVRSTRRTTASCRQPDPRPNLELVRLRPALAASGPVAEVTIRNSGRTDTLAPAVVALRVGGVDQPSQTVPPLGPGVTAVVTFPLERCDPGQDLEVTVDPADGIDEAAEDDNSAVRPCG